MSNLEPNVLYYFNTFHDALELVRTDCGEVKDEMAASLAGAYTICANIWTLRVHDIVSPAEAVRLADRIRAQGLTEAIKWAQDRANDLRHTELGVAVVDDYVSALMSNGKSRDEAIAKAIVAYSYPKRFNPGKTPNLKGGVGIAAFRDLQQRKRDDRGRDVSLKALDATPFSVFARDVLSLQSYYLKEWIGEGPAPLDEMDYQYMSHRRIGEPRTWHMDVEHPNRYLPQLSPGSGLAMDFSTSRIKAVKLTQLVEHPANQTNAMISRTRKSKERDVYAYLFDFSALFGACIEERKSIVSADFDMETSYVVTTPCSLVDVWEDEQEVSHWMTPRCYISVFEMNSEGCCRMVNHVQNATRWSSHYLVVGVSSPFSLCARRELYRTIPAATTTKVYPVHAILLHEVPKTFDKWRVIGIERPARMSRQLHTKRELQKRLERAHVGAAYLFPLRNQEQNRRLAAFGAAHPNLCATSDVTAASDGIISRVLPAFPGGWRVRFDEIRPQAYVYDAKHPETAIAFLYTQMPMGCGHTFAAESGFFGSLGMVARDIAIDLGLVDVQAVRATVEAIKATHDHDLTESEWEILANCLVSTYGDDVVGHPAVIAVYTGLLTMLGFTVNESKTYLSDITPFRESCGQDSYALQDASPVYFPRSGVGDMHLLQTGEYTFSDSCMLDFVKGESVETTQLSTLIQHQHALWAESPHAAVWLAWFIRKIEPRMTAHIVGSECADLWAAADDGVPCYIVLDEQDNKPRMRYVPESEGKPIIVRDSLGECVANARTAYLAPVSQYPDFDQDKPTDRDECDFDLQHLNAYRVDSFLAKGAVLKDEVKVLVSAGNAEKGEEAQYNVIPWYEKPNLNALVGEPTVKWGYVYE